jgi:hypothetical protein
MPVFYIDLRKDSVYNWMKLFAPAIRCAVEECEHKWVFLLFRWNDVSRHSTACYFTGKHQTLFDPSGALKTVRDKNNNQFVSHVNEGSCCRFGVVLFLKQPHLDFKMGQFNR